MISPTWAASQEDGCLLHSSSAGSSVNAARKIAMLICAVGVIPVVFAYRVESTWAAVWLIGLAAACAPGFLRQPVYSDLRHVSRSCRGSVVGIGGMAGAIGGFLIATLVGHLLQWTGSYTDSLCDRRFRVFAGACGDSYSVSQVGTRSNRRSDAAMNPESEKSKWRWHESACRRTRLR